MYYILSRSRLILLVLLISVLTSCSTSSVTTPPGNNDIHYIASVDIDASMSQAELEAMYGGQTVVFKPEAGFAVLGFNKEQGELTTLTTSKNQDALSAPEVDAHGSSAWASGHSSWAAGSSAWASGNSAWASGNSAWASGNSAWASGWSAWASGYSAWASGYSAWAGGYSAWAGGLPAKNNSRPLLAKKGVYLGQI